MLPITKNEYDNLPDYQKRNVIWQWLETLDSGVQFANSNNQLLQDRLTKVETMLAEIAARLPR